MLRLFCGRPAAGAAILFLAASAVLAQPATAPQQTGAPGVLALLPADVTTSKIAEIDGRTVSYSATAGTMPLFDGRGQQTAAVFYTAYTLTGTEARERPVTFVFNGGPGASAAYLHLGLVGPRIAEFGEGPDGADARLVDNPGNWLAFTDLVMVDPIGSGWSRTARPEDARGFWNVDGDASTLAKVVALYLARNGRTQSPKYLLGESYGGFRAVKVARALQREQGTIIAGISMVSPFLEGSFQWGDRAHALGEALRLPSIAAAELDRRGAWTEEAMAAAEHFAMTEYLVTLAGPPPQGEKGQRFYARVAELTGLPVDLVTRMRGFIADAYLETLRDREGGVASPYDAAFIAPDPYPHSDSAGGDDPILDGYLQGLGNLFVGYAREELGFRTDMTYRVLNRETSRRWDWERRGGRFLASASDDLRELMALNPGFRLLIGHGRSDLVTPYAISSYVVDHLPHPDAARAAVEVYRGGHMFYFDAGPRTAFTADARAFYGSAMR